MVIFVFTVYEEGCQTFNIDCIMLKNHRLDGKITVDPDEMAHYEPSRLIWIYSVCKIGYCCVVYVRPKKKISVVRVTAEKISGRVGRYIFFFFFIFYFYFFFGLCVRNGHTKFCYVFC